jgi:hypothetical protein
MKTRQEKREFMNLDNMSIIELKQLLSCVNQDIKSIKRKENAAKKIAANNTVSELAECNIIAKRFTKTVIIENIENKKIKQDIQIQKDILEFINNGGRIITAKTRNKVKCQTFRNNKYSVFNKGHQASITGKYGFYASSNTVSL